jgi:hypothetical protein
MSAVLSRNVEEEVDQRYGGDERQARAEEASLDTRGPLDCQHPLARRSNRCGGGGNVDRGGLRFIRGSKGHNTSGKYATKLPS